MARHTRQLLFYTWETKTKRVRFCCENGISYSLHGLHVFELFFGMRFFGHFCQYARHALTEIRLIWITIFSKLKNCLLVVTFHLMVRRYTDSRWFLHENAAYIPAMYWVSGFWMKINQFFFVRMQPTNVAYWSNEHLCLFKSSNKLFIASFNTWRYFLMWSCNCFKCLLKIEAYDINCDWSIWQQH